MVIEPLDEAQRPEPPMAGSEWEMLTGYLEFHRATLAWKVSGLGSEGLRQTVGASSMTLIGLLKHLAYVEDEWAVHRLMGEERPAPWADIDWDAQPDWDWESALAEPDDAVWDLWQTSIQRSRELLAAAHATGGLDAPLARAFPDGQRPTLRWLAVHLVEEYARHNGHADLLREAADGLTGE